MQTLSTPYIIAEIGQAHDGSLGMAHSYIDALAAAGVDAVKFQMHIARAESSAQEPFRVKFSREDATRFDYWKRMEFTFEQWQGLKAHCDEAGVEFLCSPFSNLAVSWLENLGVKRYKIGSGEVNNFLLLERIAQTGKPVILSSGMSSFNELDNTVAFLRSKNVSFSILQCTTAYPTSPEQFGLNVVGQLRERYQVTVGFSDHSARPEACIAAAALGAEIFEFHAVYSREQFGPDTKSSLTISEISQLVESLRNIHRALAHPVDKTSNVTFSDLKAIFEKSLAVNKELSAGHRLSFEDLEAKKPKGMGISAADFQKIVGRTLKKSKESWDFINEEDLHE